MHNSVTVDPTKVPPKGDRALPSWWTAGIPNIGFTNGSVIERAKLSKAAELRYAELFTVYGTTEVVEEETVTVLRTVTISAPVHLHAYCTLTAEKLN